VLERLQADDAILLVHHRDVRERKPLHERPQDFVSFPYPSDMRPGIHHLGDFVVEVHPSEQSPTDISIANDPQKPIGFIRYHHEANTRYIEHPQSIADCHIGPY
jgi:hypothetical protein